MTALRDHSDPPALRLELGDFWRSLPPEKRRRDALWTKLVLRPVSMPVAFGLHRLGFTANQVSFTGLLLSLVAVIGIATPWGWAALAAAALYNIVALLDCADGNIARATRGSAPGGEWIDASVGYFIYATLPLGLGVNLAWGGEGGAAVLGPVLGGVAASLNVFARLLHQKFVVEMGRAEVRGAPGAFARLRDRVSEEIGLTGAMMPALFVCVAAGWTLYFLAFYAAFYVAVAALVTVRLVGRVLSGRVGPPTN